MKKIVASVLIISVLYSCTSTKLVGYVVTPAKMTSKDGVITIKRNGVTGPLPDTTMQVYLIQKRRQ